jgi:hypothetical protein
VWQSIIAKSARVPDLGRSRPRPLRQVEKSIVISFGARRLSRRNSIIDEPLPDIRPLMY